MGLRELIRIIELSYVSVKNARLMGFPFLGIRGETE